MSVGVVPYLFSTGTSSQPITQTMKRARDEPVAEDASGVASPSPL